VDGVEDFPVSGVHQSPVTAMMKKALPSAKVVQPIFLQPTRKGRDSLLPRIEKQLIQNSTMRGSGGSDLQHFSQAAWLCMIEKPAFDFSSRVADYALPQRPMFAVALEDRQHPFQ
jgi:hypothetical protein